MLPTIYIGSLPASSSDPAMTETGSAPLTGDTLTPTCCGLQHMTTGTEGGEPVSVTLASPVDEAPSGSKIELWITANSETTLDISAYVIPSGSSLTSPVTLLSGETYIFLFKKGIFTTWDWNLVSFVGGYKLELG